jgi:hypothetical protein
MEQVRDSKKNHEYYSKAIDDRKNKIHDFLLATKNIDHPNIGGVWTFIQNYYFELADLMYSRGDKFESIKPIIEEGLKSQKEKMHHYRKDRISLQNALKPEKTNNYPEFIKAYSQPATFQHFFSILGYISRAILFDIEYSTIIKFAEDAIKPGTDFLIDSILNRINSNWAITGKANYSKRIGELYTAISSNDLNEVNNNLKLYSIGWLKKLKGHPRYAPYMFNDLNYVGYWCFEAAAICKLKKIDLLSFEGVKYFPSRF